MVKYKNIYKEERQFCYACGEEVTKNGQCRNCGGNNNDVPVDET